MNTAEQIFIDVCDTLALGSYHFEPEFAEDYALQLQNIVDLNEEYAIKSVKFQAEIAVLKDLPECFTEDKPRNCFNMLQKLYGILSETEMKSVA